MFLFATCVYLRGNLRVRLPPNASLYAGSSRVHLRLLAGPLGQGLTRASKINTLLSSLSIFRRALFLQVYRPRLRHGPDPAKNRSTFIALTWTTR